MKSNRLLIPSLLLNAALLCLAGHSLSHKPQAPAAMVSRPDSAPAILPVKQVPAPAFTWSQVEADDYRDYMVKLQNIGCPERTIRDIITADLGHLYDEKRQAASASGISSLMLREKLAKISEEQASVVASLFPSSVPPSVPGQNAAQTQRMQSAQQPVDDAPEDTTVEMPLAFVGNLPNMSEEQTSALANLRKEFLAGLNKTSGNPNDPAYLQRWVEEQPKLDERFQVLFGDEAFNQLQNKATSQAAR